MREIYLPAFEAAVTKAHVDAVMDSYNLVNGVHSTQNDFLNLKVLKGEWGFQGILMSDWDATYDGVAACNNGLDLEMPSPKFMNAKNLLPAVQSGAVKESTIDEHVLRLFAPSCATASPRARNSIPPTPPTPSPTALLALAGSSRKHHAAQNEGHLLPLDPAKVKNIAVIGPDAYPAVTGGGGSSQAHAFEPVSILTGIANLLGPNVHVFYSAGYARRRPLRRRLSSRPTSSSSPSASIPKPRARATTAPSPCRRARTRSSSSRGSQSAHHRARSPAGGGIDTSRWLDKVPACLHALLSRARRAARPSRKSFSASTTPRANCPSRFDRSWDENPSAKWYYGDPKDNTILHTTGENGKPKDYTIEHIKYGDKLMVGYRYWTTTGKHPLFPFGFGLSYTTFSFSNLQAPASARSPVPDGSS